VILGQAQNPLGDGMAQLDRLIPLIVQAGYRGYFDLELIGPRI
jgi:hypothetical protein